MKLNNIFTAAGIALLSFITLTSFYKGTCNETNATNTGSQNSIAETSNNEDPQATIDDDDKKYNGTNKKTTNSNAFTIGSSFHNDYYNYDNKEGFYYYELKAVTYKNENATHTPLNLAIVIDRSGSMSGEKINNVRKAAKQMIDNMHEDDYISIVMYDSEVDLLQANTRVTNKQALKNKIDKIYDRSGTNLCGGMLRGYKEIENNYKSGYINRVLLLSDGLANEGITNTAEIERYTRRYLKEENISISTFGVGNDYNEDLMTSLAENGAGNYYFINHAEDIAKILNKELNGIMEVVAKNCLLTITIPEFVTILNVKGGVYDQVGRNIKIHMRDIFSKETKGILIHYKIENRENRPCIFTSYLTYNDARNEQAQYVELKNTQEYSTNDQAIRTNYNEWVEGQVTLYEINTKLDYAAKEADKGNYDNARKIVAENKAYISKKSKIVEKNEELQRVSTANTSYQESLKDAEAMPASEFKTIQKSSKEEQYKIRSKK